MEGKNRKVYVSKILQWYHSDFGYVEHFSLVVFYFASLSSLRLSFARRTDEEMLGWIASFAPEDKAHTLNEWVKQGKVKVKYFPYDWGQNKK